MSTHPEKPAPVICIVGARPNYMKVAPIIRAFAAHNPPIPTLLVHTGQHYDPAMKDRLFADLELPEPLYNLEVGSGSHALQTGRIMAGIEEVLVASRPDVVLVEGDTNSVLAAALAASQAGISGSGSGGRRPNCREN